MSSNKERPQAQRDWAQGLSASRRAYNTGMRALIYIAAAIVVALLIFLLGYILYRGLPNLTPQFLTSEESVVRDIQGIGPAIVNTIYVIIATLIVVLPLGVGSAIYLTEYATNHKLVSAIEFATETLAGIPSIIYALVGVLIFAESLALGKTLIAGAFTLVIMTLPTVIRTTQESLKTVPASYREGSLGLGSGKWHMIRTVVLPSSIDGIVTGCILAIGRIVGESAVLLYTVGMSMSMQNFFRNGLESFFSASGSTLSVALYVYAKVRADFDLAFSVAVVLIVITLVINLAANLVGKKLKKK